MLLGELLNLLRYRYEQINFIDEPVDLGFDCPPGLTIPIPVTNCALNFLKPATVREGVKWLPEKQLDVFFVTLNKADKDTHTPPCIKIIPSTKTCSTGKSRAPQQRTLPLDSGTSITGSVEVRCCCLSRSSRWTGSQGARRPIPFWAQPTM